MIVPAKRVYLTDEKVADLKVGDEVNKCSGMGGSYTLEIKAITPKGFYLECKMKDHEHRVRVDPEAASSTFFDLVADY